MDGYDATVRAFKEKPVYMPIIKKCVGAHHETEKQPYGQGFEWDDLNVTPIRLSLLATEFDLLQVTYKSNSATRYMVKDISGVERALQDIDAGKIGSPSTKGGMAALKVWLSEPTMAKLRGYVAREMPGLWDAEALVIERSLNLFLDQSGSSSGPAMAQSKTGARDGEK